MCPQVGRNERNQDCVYWPYVGRDQYGNAVVSTTPEEIKVRWEEDTEETQSGQESPINSQSATVFVDCYIQKGSRLWLGCLDDLPVGFDTNTAYQVTGNISTPNLKATLKEYTLTVTRR